MEKQISVMKQYMEKAGDSYKRNYQIRKEERRAGEVNSDMFCFFLLLEAEWLL